ncbi:MAG: hypothetical protein LBI69_02575 [Puniceicoccales bacterium]|jgi:hypothetical protein|nr:hypothetical protein [Puniceicoccales bacterium]
MATVAARILTAAHRYLFGDVMVARTEYFFKGEGAENANQIVQKLKKFNDICVNRMKENAVIAALEEMGDAASWAIMDIFTGCEGIAKGNRQVSILNANTKVAAKILTAKHSERDTFNDYLTAVKNCEIVEQILMEIDSFATIVKIYELEDGWNSNLNKNAKIAARALMALRSKSEISKAIEMLLSMDRGIATEAILEVSDDAIIVEMAMECKFDILAQILNENNETAKKVLEALHLYGSDSGEGLKKAVELLEKMSINQAAKFFISTDNGTIIAIVMLMKFNRVADILKENAEAAVKILIAIKDANKGGGQLVNESEIDGYINDEWQQLSREKLKVVKYLEAMSPTEIANALDQMSIERKNMLNSNSQAAAVILVKLCSENRSGNLQKIEMYIGEMDFPPIVEALLGISNNEVTIRIAALMMKSRISRIAEALNFADNEGRATAKILTALRSGGEEEESFKKYVAEIKDERIVQALLRINLNATVLEIVKIKYTLNDAFSRIIGAVRNPLPGWREAAARFLIVLHEENMKDDFAKSIRVDNGTWGIFHKKYAEIFLLIECGKMKSILNGNAKAAAEIFKIMNKANKKEEFGEYLRMMQPNEIVAALLEVDDDGAVMKIIHNSIVISSSMNTLRVNPKVVAKILVTQHRKCENDEFITYLRGIDQKMVLDALSEMNDKDTISKIVHTGEFRDMIFGKIIANAKAVVRALMIIDDKGNAEDIIKSFSEIGKMAILQEMNNGEIAMKIINTLSQDKIMEIIAANAKCAAKILIAMRAKDYGRFEDMCLRKIEQSDLAAALLKMDNDSVVSKIV